MGFLKFLAGAVLGILGFLGMVASIIGFFTGKLQETFSHTPVATWPAILIGVVSFVMFIGGVYLIRNDP